MKKVQMENAVETRRVAGVRFRRCGKVYHFDCSMFRQLRKGDFVVVETSRGRQVGQVIGFPNAKQNGRGYKAILRIATPRDLVTRQAWQVKEEEALATCQEKAAALGGFEDVKFIRAEYNSDGSALTVLYSAENRINTAKLRSALRKSLRTRVELRQIGPRDVAKELGGYGACGELQCCSAFLTEFNPISIKMAKAQRISLNPSEITGICGRLRCCLLYEYEAYVRARENLPRKGKQVGTPHGEGKVVDMLPMQDAVVVMVEDARYTVAREDLIPLEELEALKNGSSRTRGQR
jgi:cell fate regulator YaaT (PSP1 superfamily)